MKLHKLNSTGTLGIVIPKDIATSLGWKESQDVIVLTTDQDFKLVVRNMTLENEHGREIN